VTYFEYEAIYFGIIVGLALANILTSVHKLVEAGSRVRWGWMAPASAAYAATLTINEFWYVWIRQHDGHRTILTWYPLAVAFALLFLLCAAALPDDAELGEVDLTHYYMENRHRFWGFSAGLHAFNLVSWAVRFAVFGATLQFAKDNGLAIVLNGVEFVLSLTLVFTRAKWWHALVLVGLWAWSIVYFGPMQLN
jgi:hypothetical protein